MNTRIIEIVELGQPKSLIQRENAPITELIETNILIKELNEQLALCNVVVTLPFEFIICAAIWFNDGNKYNHQPKNVEYGFVVLGRRHHNCFSSVQSIGKALGYDKTLIVKKGIVLEEKEKQGFITNKDRFVDRIEAAQIAYEAKQIDKPLKRLFSEDLY